jgi:prepilin-type N-terminal cleavage/methylation domain-containing protein
MNKGFTLLEILIVIALIGVLTAFGLASYTATQKTGRNSRRTADLKVIQNSLETYYGDTTVYPGGSCDPGITYLPQGMPKDPRTNVVYTPASCTASVYCFCADMEGGSGSNSDSSCNFAAATKTHFCVKNLQ